ncbi:DNA-directed RNA polymerase subunit alpha, partial [bacterium]|nr:DNA-directed RNA polymerase subunit alpha [bacterium]
MNIPLPNEVKINNEKGNKAQVIIEPCYPGYGVTLGNSLRRVLLSSLEGGAITSFKIKGTDHEFSHLPNVKEDLIEIILNLKAIRLKIFSDEPVILNIKVKGEKEIKASDITKNAEVEISNPKQLICTVTDKSTEFEMELTVAKGHGYVSVEERESEKVDIGVIKVDSIYTPMKNVGFEIENV